MYQLFFMNQNRIPVIVLALSVQLFLLFIANVWNAWIIIHSAPGANLFHVVDFFWPIANTFLLVTTTMILTAKGIKGWKRYLPLLVALLLHLGLFLLYIFSGRNNATMLIGGAYSVIAWVLLGYLVTATPSAPRTKSLKEKYESNKKYMLAIN